MAITVAAAVPVLAGAAGLIHDAEYYILEAQNGERWTAEDTDIVSRLSDIRGRNGGSPPNIIYILLDDVGFGELGMPELSVIRGYTTPRIDAFAREGLNLQRMYSEPSCTPTRVAMMTGRYAVRTGLNEAKATLAGEGLAAEEITLAEVLREAGYYTSHVGKWHMGEHRAGVCQQPGLHACGVPSSSAGSARHHAHSTRRMPTSIRGVDPAGQAQTFTLDKNFVANPSDMVTGLEMRDGKLYEVDLKPGEKWTQKKYREMNERYQQHAAGADPHTRKAGPAVLSELLAPVSTHLYPDGRGRVQDAQRGNDRREHRGDGSVGR